MPHHGNSVLQAQVAEILAEAQSVGLAKPRPQAAFARLHCRCQLSHGKCRRKAIRVMTVNRFEKFAVRAGSRTFVRTSPVGGPDQTEEDSGEDGLQLVRHGFPRSVSGSEILQQLPGLLVRGDRRVTERAQRSGIGEFESDEQPEDVIAIQVVVGVQLVREDQMGLPRHQAVGRAVEIEGAGGVEIDHKDVACVQPAFESAPLQIPARPAHERQQVERPAPRIAACACKIIRWLAKSRGQLAERIHR